MAGGEDTEGRSQNGAPAAARATRVKICGVTSVEDARMCAEAGADAIGVNLVANSLRRVDVATARAIAEAVGGETLVVGVVADMGVEAMIRLRSDAQLGCLQLHGDEPPPALLPLLPHAYKALRIGGAADVARAGAYGGRHVLVDARVEGALGGTGHTFEWSWVLDLARTRQLTLAGGLTPENVADAVRAVRPFCVDVASGVERSAGVKEPARVRAFIAAARRA